MSGGSYLVVLFALKIPFIKLNRISYWKTFSPHFFLLNSWTDYVGYLFCLLVLVISFSFFSFFPDACMDTQTIVIVKLSIDINELLEETNWYGVSCKSKHCYNFLKKYWENLLTSCKMHNRPSIHIHCRTHWYRIGCKKDHRYTYIACSNYWEQSLEFYTFFCRFLLENEKNFSWIMNFISHQ